MKKTITPKIVVAYAQCPRKAYLLLHTDEQGLPHEYVRILEQRKIANQNVYLDTFRQQHPNAQLYNIDGLKSGSPFLINGTLQAGMCEAACGILTRVETASSLGEYSYEPAIFVGTHRINKDQKLALFFVGYVLEQVQGIPPVMGRIVGMGSKSHKVKLENSDKTLLFLLEDLQEWLQTISPESPPLILNKHCPYCQFERLCRVQAEKKDNLSLLDRVTPKVIRRYEKKGIFTVRQLSYLYKPRRRKKRTKNPPPARHKLELQALAIRTGKIYLETLPELTRQPVELFLDIEGVPDEQYHYLIGLLVCEGDTCAYYPFWADTRKGESQMWQQFMEKADQYPDAPIYHYGSYEPRTITKLARRYETDGDGLKSRLVNVNTYIFGTVYFPVRSNRLKDIGAFIGAKWTSSDASGLQSLVWRYRWDETRDTQYQSLLLIYNQEDCRALRLLVDELSRIKHSADTLSEVDFANQPKRYATEAGKEVHSQFEAILEFAHTDYDKKKISFRQDKKKNGKKRRRGPNKKGYQGHRKVRPKPTEIVQVPQGGVCPKCGSKSLQPTQQISKRLIIDLILIENGIKKTITEYIGFKEYCSECRKLYNSPGISKYWHMQLYGHGFKSWLIYHRVGLRLPYETVGEMMEEQFGERVFAGSLVVFIKQFAQCYAETERMILSKLLDSPFIHVDETKVNIQGTNWYAWIFTDGKYVHFKLTETREATIVHELLTGYEGVLISDFYPGYDSVECRQQKCWIHLVRDINDDLWDTPFDAKFEMFVLEVRNLIVPIMETVQEYGLKEQHLGKFKAQVEDFYNRVVVDQHYKSELVLKYQNRFVRYQDSLFTFLEQDGIPWHNNTAENPLRHLARLRVISTSFSSSVMDSYLVLLGIGKTCRFQGKSFFRFLFSGEKDIDKFGDLDASAV